MMDQADKYRLQSSGEHANPFTNNPAFLRQLLETIPVPIFFKDNEGRYRGGNSPWTQKIIGLPLTQIVGKTLNDLPKEIPPHLADLYHNQDIKLMRAGGVQVYEAPVRCADGEIRDFQFHKASIRNKHGKVVGLIGVMIDITEKNQAQRLLKQESERYKDFFLSEKIGIYQSSVDGRMLRVNPAFLKLFGYESMAELEQVNAQSLYAHPEERRELLAELNQKGLLTRNFTLVRKNGTFFKVRALAKLTGEIITGYLTEIVANENEYLMVVCASCFNIREGPEGGPWLPPTDFFIKHKDEIKDRATDYGFSHSICPQCGKKLYGDLYSEFEED